MPAVEPLSSNIIIITVQRLFPVLAHLTRSVSCTATVQVASKLVQTPNLVDTYSVPNTHEQV